LHELTIKKKEVKPKKNLKILKKGLEGSAESLHREAQKKIFITQEKRPKKRWYSSLAKEEILRGNMVELENQ